MRYDSEDWDGALAALRDASDIVIACHVNPDGDALGALLGASLGLRKLGKKTYPTWGAEKVEPPPNYAFLPAIDTLCNPGELPASDTLLALDCGAGDRLADLQDRAKKTKTVINVDHHPGNDDFGRFNIVVPSASSTAELVTRLLEDLDVELDRDIATCLYTGVVTDTGRFQYSNSRPETLRLAADLLAYGVPAPQIALEVFASAPFTYLKLLGRVLDRAKLHEAEAFVYSWVDLRDLKECGVAQNETDQLIDDIRSTRDAKVAAIFKEQRDGDYRVSLRSKGPVSVGEIARANGGGGHELAAGFTAKSISAGVDAICKAIHDS